jgi:hypothetical protein
VRVERALRRLREARVIRRDEGGHVRVRGVNGTDAAQPQFLHEPVLQRQVRTLDAALPQSSQLHAI